MDGIIIGIIVIALALLVWWISIGNGIKKLEIKVDEALSGIDVALTKRYDVLTKMVDVVKGYKEYEQETLQNIVELRKGMTMQERNSANQQMDTLAKQITLLAENYPNLKASENFAKLQEAITDVEEHLQASRRLYNSNVTAYNQRIIVFPNSLVAGSMGATKKEFFEAEEIKKQDVSMKF
ncbi:MAG: LemA family protein [Wujia sp.]